MANHQHAAAEVLCPACDFGPFQRNAYWTGKLMLAGDFVAEQRYFMEKLRHHNLHLHGSGVVCGLKVVQHDKDECRNRFVCVEPGTAIDCCGHEIVLRFKECIDLDTIPALKALKDKNDTTKHTLAVCIRYRECETEHVPVLYDECGCDDDKCAPNRVLEAFELDVMVDPKLPEAPTLPDQCGDLWRTSVEGCAALRSARLHRAGDDHGLRRRRQDRRPACAAAVFASRRRDRQLHRSPHPAERAADQGSHRLHADEGPGRRRPGRSRGSQVRRVPQVRRALQVRPVLRVRLVLRVHKAHLVLSVRSGRPARTV